jgi:hypothetical protein
LESSIDLLIQEIKKKEAQHDTRLPQLYSTATEHALALWSSEEKQLQRKYELLERLLASRDKMPATDTGEHV